MLVLLYTILPLPSTATVVIAVSYTMLFEVSRDKTVRSNLDQLDLETWDLTGLCFFLLLRKFPSLTQHMIHKIHVNKLVNSGQWTHNLLQYSKITTI